MGDSCHIPHACACSLLEQEAVCAARPRQNIVRQPVAGLSGLRPAWRWRAAVTTQQHRRYCFVWKCVFVLYLSIYRRSAWRTTATYTLLINTMIALPVSYNSRYMHNHSVRGCCKSRYRFIRRHFHFRIHDSVFCRAANCSSACR